MSVRVAAKIISFVFHPLLITTYLVLMLGLFFPAMLMISRANLVLLALLVLVFTFVIPAGNLLLFRFLGSINSLHLKTREERIWPFIFISLMYGFVTFIFYYKLPFNSNFNKLLFIITALVVTATVITFFIKVSVHSMAMCGWIGILLPLIKFSPALLWPTATIIAITGLVISARLTLDAHTPRETLIGAVVGVLVGFGGMIVMF
ncbi:hypothetical protein WSM22_02140 [Cytophagales bacterium WSM2-2]|nr:hypothetical protein WSM22_02140 [Cytophagales bacterium WSM2-2]